MKLFVVAIALLGVCYGRRLPEGLKACPRNSQDFASCLKQALEKARPHIEKGVPKMHLPPGDPMVIPKLVIDRSLDAVSIKATLTDIVAIGGSKFIIKDIKVDLPKMEGEITVSVPKVQASNTYDIKGNVLAMQLNGSGKMTGEFSNTKATIYCKFAKVERKGKSYFEIEDIKSKIRMDDARIKLVEANPNNQPAADAAVQFFHQNPRQLLELVAPIIDETASEVIKSIINQVLEVVPADELLPEN